MDTELHRADPNIRRWATPVFVVVALLGGIAVWALDAWLDARAVDAAGFDAMLLVAAGVVAVLATVAFGLALALWQEAQRIRREDRFPASDMRTLRDVPVRHGVEARRMARSMVAGAALAALTGAGILAWGWRLVTL